MKQRQLGLGRQRPGQQSTLKGLREHAVAALWAIAVMATLAVSTPRAEALPPHARPRPVAEATHGRSASHVTRNLAKAGPVKKSVVGKSGRAALAAENTKAARRTSSGRGRIDPPLPARRVNFERGRSQPSKAESPRRFAQRKAEAPLGVEPDPPVEVEKALTVDDFARAVKGADAPAAEAATTTPEGVYARGESHPEDDRLALLPTPTRIAAKRPMAVKSVGESADEMATLPVGTLLSDGSVSSASSLHEKGSGYAAIALPAPTQQEITEEVEQPLVLPGLYRNGRLVVPAPLKGTHEILVHQNSMADDEGLERIQDDDDLRRLRAAHLLVNFTETASLHINPELAADRRCARVWTVRFANDISRAFYARFHEPLQVNSAVRTVAYQVRLQRINGNAAGTDGEAASPHLTGQAMDLGKRGMSLAQIAWMRGYLLPLMQAGKIDVEEEFQQACFHISVYRTYLPVVPAKRRAVPRTEVAQLHVPRVAKAAARVADDSR
jgi:hypothetical protein